MKRKQSVLIISNVKKMKLTKLFSKIFDKLPSKKKAKKISNFRKSIFGIRFRLIFGFSLIFLISMSILLIITYSHQYNLLLNEKIQVANNLSKTISSVSEILLENDLDRSKLELENKRRFVYSNIESFININQDVLQVVVTDKNKKIILSKGQKIIPPTNIKAILSKVENQKILDTEKTNISSGTTNIYKCKIIILPLYQTSGLLVSINEDFDKIYKKLYETGLNLKDKERIYDYLKNKYSEILEDKIIKRKIQNPESKKQDEIIITKDIDYLFLELYKYLYVNGKLTLDRKSAYLLDKDWLDREKRNIEKGIIEGNLTLVKNSYEEIFKEISKLREFGEKSKFIGYNIVVFNITKISKEINNYLRNLIIIFLSIYTLSIITIFLVSKVYVKNIKKLENWAIEITNGNLSAKVDIKSNDEIGRLSDIFNHMLEEIISKYHLEKFVSKSTINMIKEKKDKELYLGKVGRKNLAFMFSDIRGFTNFSEKNDPEIVIEILNTYLDIQSRIVKKYKGDIDDFVGDQIMAHFGGEKKADTAIKVAIEIIQSIDKLNKDRKEKNLPIFEIGIGIHIGDVVIGNIGTEFRMDFACIGDTVNTCSRLCSIAKPMEIIASKSIIEASSGKFKFIELPPISLKGKEKPFEICKIIV